VYSASNSSRESLSSAFPMDKIARFLILDLASNPETETIMRMTYASNMMKPCKEECACEHEPLVWPPGLEGRFNRMTQFLPNSLILSAVDYEFLRDMMDHRECPKRAMLGMALAAIGKNPKLEDVYLYKRQTLSHELAKTKQMFIQRIKTVPHELRQPVMILIHLDGRYQSFGYPHKSALKATATD
jgi:hypothetical protein